MKKIYLIFTFLLICLTSFGTGEEVWVAVFNGYAKAPSQLNPVNPCSQLLFYCDVHIPDGYAIVSKYEWFVNGISLI